MRKFVSQHNKQKVQDAPVKMFGVPLDELVRLFAAEGGASVPAPVKKLCEHIYRHGVNEEGIFRMSGSAVIVEKLKTAFNLTGDADLEADGDIMAVAGVLKLFLRELPDSVIPEHLTKEFLAIQAGKSYREDYILRLRSRLQSLPEENYALLKYIVCFLVAVSSHQDTNKMGHTALATVFGPNIFRCHELKIQGMINLIVSEFITSYKDLFQDENETDPAATWKLRMKKSPPPRPPPPQLTLSTRSQAPFAVQQDIRPVPAPRTKQGLYDSSQYQDVDDADKNGATGTSVCSDSPHFSDEEVKSHGRASPFVLESESHSIIESPMVTARTSELVEKIICDTITEKLFGSDLISAGGSPLSGKSADSSSPDQRLQDTDTSVHCQLEMLDKQKSLTEELKSELRSSACASPPWLANGDLTQKGGGDTVYSNAANEEFNASSQHNEIHGNVMTEGTSKYLAPAQKFYHVDDAERQGGLEKKEVDVELTELLEETAIVVSGGSFQTHKWKKVIEHDNRERACENKEDINHNHQAKQIKLAFLNIHENQENVPAYGEKLSPERSPLSRHKPNIPPLDLSTLHETVDGLVPVLASSSQTGSWDRKLKVQLEDTNGVPSPRANKLKKRTGSPSDSDAPPSPPKYQDQQYQKNIIDEDYSYRYKQLTKKIQGLKKKIKVFEDEFEQDHKYKPSQGEKAARPEVKKYMADLSRVRKELKKLKEDCERGNRSRHGSGASSSGDCLDTPKVEETLDAISISLKGKRQESSRPEDLTLMTKDQVQEEKLAIQKALLHFESVHGRPTSREDKDIMRPLYDRYRAVKRMLARPSSPRNSLELHLPPVPEDQMMEIPSGSSVSVLFQRKAIHVPTGGEDNEETLDTMDFAVTRDLSFMRQTISQFSNSGIGHDDTVHPKVRKKNADEEQTVSAESNLHEMGMQELHEQLESSKGEKKKLRQHLREFEKSFHEKHGRKVQKEDRAPMQDHYNQYKQVKARLRLLEALVLKHYE